LSEERRKVSFGDTTGVGIVKDEAIGRRCENSGRVAVGPTPGVGPQMVCTAHDLPPVFWLTRLPMLNPSVPDQNQVFAELLPMSAYDPKRTFERPTLPKIHPEIALD
jgi:hypothetical protein